MNNVYYDPSDLGLTPVGDIEWSDGNYQFDMTVVWKRDDGAFVYAEDSGCSCPSPFEDLTPDQLEPATPLASFQEHLNGRNAHGMDGDRSGQIAELLERMHAAGAR